MIRRLLVTKQVLSQLSDTSASRHPGLGRDRSRTGAAFCQLNYVGEKHRARFELAINGGCSSAPSATRAPVQESKWSIKESNFYFHGADVVFSH